MILRGSRYQNAQITGIRTADGRVRKYVHDRPIFQLPNVGAQAEEHLLSGGEELDSIADLYYKRDTDWWVIADVNDIFFMFDAKPGDVLLVPSRAMVDEFLRTGA